jgi:ABC-type Mn2+/Zn2+ transport system permease subunit
MFNIKVIARSFAAICVALGFIAVYIFQSESGWIFVILGFLAFVITFFARE